MAQWGLGMDDAGPEKIWTEGETGRKLRWDAVAERFTNSDEANRFLSRPARKAY